jgi:dihydroflavonol-4-reductase
LGSNLVRQLLAAGYEVKALARSRDKAAQILGDTRAEIIVGDMENVEGFAPHLAGVDVLFHTAAYFREYFTVGDHWATLEKINVRATIQVLNEAEQRGVKKAIYTSSSTVIGANPKGSASDESTPPDRHTEANLYAKSKVLAEAAVADFLKSHRLPVVLVLPTAMFGPGDAAPTRAGQIIQDFMRQELSIIPPGGFSVVDVRDVAQATINAVQRGKSGERYILNNRYYSLGEILSMLERVTGIPGPTRRVPYAGALMVAYLGELRARLTGAEPQITVSAVRILTQGGELSADKARRELGFATRPFEDTLRDEVAWYAERGVGQNRLHVAVIPPGM